MTCGGKKGELAREHIYIKNPYTIWEEGKTLQMAVPKKRQFISCILLGLLVRDPSNHLKQCRYLLKICVDIMDINSHGKNINSNKG